MITLLIVFLISGFLSGVFIKFENGNPAMCLGFFLSSLIFIYSGFLFFAEYIPRLVDSGFFEIIKNIKIGG